MKQMEKIMPKEKTNVREYSQGVCGDGAAILCDGEMITIEVILSRLQGFEKQLSLISGIVGDGELCDVDTQACDFIQVLSERIEGLEQQLLCIDQAVRKNDWTVALQSCMAARATVSINDVKNKGIEEFKEELFKSISIVYRPHIEGVVAVLEERRKQK
jgi:hypothetical protein